MNETTDDADLEAGRRERNFDAMIQLFCKRYGVTEDEIPELIEKARWSGEHRHSIDRLSWSAALGVVGAIATGLALVVWEGIKHSLGNHGP